MIQLINIQKNYGNVVGVDGVSLTVKDGTIMGLLGKNGAGKSTIMNILTGYLCADSGQVLLSGVDIRRDPVQAKAKFGYMPESPPLYYELTVDEYLRFAAGLRGIKKEDINKTIERVCSLLNIEDVRKRLIGTLSKGYKQRVGFAQALCSDARIIILDEPTSGLDPQQIVDVKEIIKGMRGEYTVLMSSHILSEISDVCDEITIMDSGKVLETGKIDEIIARRTDFNKLMITAKGKTDLFINNIKALNGVKSVAQQDGGVYGDGVRFIVQCERDMREEVFKTAVTSEVALLDMKTEGTSLEDIFIKLTRQ